MFARQRGVTFIGWLFLLVPVAIVGYSGIRLAPIYLNYVKVARAIDQTASELKTDEAVTPKSIRDTLNRRFDIEEIMYPETKDIQIRRDGSTWIIEAQYDDEAPLFAHLSLHVSFDKTAHTG